MRRLSRIRSAGFALLILSAMLSTACATKINSVLADPSRYRTRDVTVSGTVVESFSLAERGAYMIDDGTGQLWIVVNRGTPRKGARVKVTGTVREAFNLGSLGDLIKLPGAGSGLVLIESSREARD
jgi:membrane protein implicated in regulation of membrane protease activity